MIIMAKINKYWGYVAIGALTAAAAGAVATYDTENEEAAYTDDSEKSSDKAAEVEIKDAEEEEDADEPENFEETMDAASESEE